MVSFFDKLPDDIFNLIAEYATNYGKNGEWEFAGYYCKKHKVIFNYYKWCCSMCDRGKYLCWKCGEETEREERERERKLEEEYAREYEEEYNKKVGPYINEKPGKTERIKSREKKRKLSKTRRTYIGS